MRRTAIDLDRYHARHQHGDIMVFLTWWLADDSGPKPCLVLIPTFTPLDRVTPCVVMMENAWLWSEQVGDPRQAAHTAFAFAQMLGQDTNNATNVIRIRSIIHDHIPDLITMPPMPDAMREQGEVIGEARLVDPETGRTVEQEVRDVV